MPARPLRKVTWIERIRLFDITDCYIMNQMKSAESYFSADFFVEKERRICSFSCFRAVIRYNKLEYDKSGKM